MTALLRCENIRKEFDNNVAVDHVDLTLHRGDVLGIIGANGAGKTTLINIITGYIKPSAGRIFLHDEDITHSSPRILAHKGVARSFQIPQLFESMTCIDNVMLALMLSSEPLLARLGGFLKNRRRHAAMQVLERFGIGQYADAVVSNQPQGVRKLLDVAVAMCHVPRLVLLDEPTSGVSTSEKHGVMDAIWKVLARSEVGVLFIEHDMELVRRYATRVIALYQGRVIAAGPPHEVMQNEDVQLYVTGKKV
ncbi:MAG: ABC transporter ATP-binding protein [Pseudorhodoplanes sp.]|uniref:ABC transporter ATP-binding protein n=1 Tax=Pseudorhodoplanes sp. TaxID=1934341 RepID=UPI003D0E0013